MMSARIEKPQTLPFLQGKIQGYEAGGEHTQGDGENRNVFPSQTIPLV